MKSFRNFVVLFSMALTAVAANAQAALHGKFQLTSQTRWGNTTLPAGEYSFVFESTQRPLVIVIRSQDGKNAAMVLAETSVTSAPGSSYLFLTGNGSDRTVRSMNLPQLGALLIYKPLTKRERETLHATVSQTVPVRIATK